MRTSTPRIRTSEFLISVNRIRLSQLTRDPYVAAAFRAAEEDGFDPDLVEIDNPPKLSGGAAEVIPATGRRVVVEA
jgi:hypothetical protein